MQRKTYKVRVPGLRSGTGIYLAGLSDMGTTYIYVVDITSGRNIYRFVVTDTSGEHALDLAEKEVVSKEGTEDIYTTHVGVLGEAYLPSTGHFIAIQRHEED